MGCDAPDVRSKDAATATKMWLENIVEVMSKMVSNGLSRRKEGHGFSERVLFGAKEERKRATNAKERL